MQGAAQWLERHQVVLCVLAVAGAVVLGMWAPGAAVPLEHVITPALAALLYVTFLGVPMSRVWRGLTDARFFVTLLVVNFVCVPLVAFGLSRLVASDRGVLIGVLLVLLTPCVDYVVVFAGLAGGSRERLLAATPVLLLLQLALLPVYLWLFAGAQAAGAIEAAPFVRALVVLIVIPALLAGLTQRAARRWRPARMLQGASAAAMVPLLLTTLVAVTASQVGGGLAGLDMLATVVPLFAVFVIAAAFVGIAGARIAGLDARRGIAVTFSATTRNSLVVLPFALALPAAYAVAPLVVVTQTIVELVAMVVLVPLFRSAGGRSLLRRLLPPAPRPTAEDATP
ncbi:arsenic resistance protein [Microbacterium sp. RD1]|uniref:arsenic resistance protein n=1 Tax=Microbacterium sp. RD1 TaxID=3457313 RepID=UPI003FA55B62